MQAKESRLVSQSILRRESEQRTVVQTRVPYAGSSELVFTVRDRSGSQASPPPLPHQAMGGTMSFLSGGLSSDTRKQQKLNLGHQWSLGSRISQMQAWAIPAVRKSTDPHYGPLICWLGNQGSMCGLVCV